MTAGVICTFGDNQREKSDVDPTFHVGFLSFKAKAKDSTFKAKAQD
jgi:hypothetical protein